MPCGDNRSDSSYQQGFHDGQSSVSDITTTDASGFIHSDRSKVLNDRCKKLEAMLCALLTDLEERNIAFHVIASASRNGDVNIVEFWVRHLESDESLMAEKLLSFSSQEISTIKKLLD